MPAVANKSKLPFTVEHDDRNIVTVRLEPCGSGREFWFLLRSDVHHDNPHCDQKLEHKHLDEAVERGAGIIDNGDLFCAMQGKYDKRSNKDSIRPEHQEGKYLDRLVDTAADFYAPYAENIVVLSHGNHETAILKNHETDLTDRLVGSLNGRLRERQSDHAIQAGGYSGWVRFMFKLRSTVRTSRLLYRHHGGGGGGPVTRGVIQTNRFAVFTPDAHVLLTGHTHDEWIVPIRRQRLSEAGKVFHDEQIHVRPPGYKDEWGDGYGGFSVEKMLGPKPKGAFWLIFRTNANGVETEIRQAK